jgi:hypothetical protein
MHHHFKLFAFLLFAPIFCDAQSITLRRTFIDSFKNKITINASYDVWYTHHEAKAEKEDGDIHCSGYDKKIGMPTVAEIMNAKDEQDAIDILIAHEGMGKTNNPKIDISGVWRLWPEHLGTHDFFQGMKLTKAKIQEKGKKTNPDHVFEIHPLTKIENITLLQTFKNIGPDYIPKKWKDAYNMFKTKTFTISAASKTITFSTKQVGENYIDLWVRLDSLWEIEDGAFAYCTTFDAGFTPGESISAKKITTKTRIAFVKDTDPYNEAFSKGVGGFLHLLGTPRINLAIVSWREWASKKRPEVLMWKLPFEIIADGLIEPGVSPLNPTELLHVDSNIAASICPPEGKDKHGHTPAADIVALNLLKNRRTEPLASQIDNAVTITKMLNSNDNVTRFDQHKGATITGILFDVKEEKGETCNCNSTNPNDWDLHIYISKTVAHSIFDCAVIEITPYSKSIHPEWTYDYIKSLKGKTVKVTGWLLYDFEHKGQSYETNPSTGAPYRHTVWEVHPVTSIVVTN